MEGMEFEAGLVAGYSGLDLDRAHGLVKRYLPKVGEPLWKQRLAAKQAAMIAAAHEKNTEMAFLSGKKSEECQCLALAFKKISYLAQREVEIMESRLK
jgi:hypothetical protein